MREIDVPPPSSVAPPPSRIVVRALLAAALTAGVYGLALAVACGILLVPCLEFSVLRAVEWKTAVTSLLGAGVVLWSVAPPRRLWGSSEAASHPERAAGAGLERLIVTARAAVSRALEVPEGRGPATLRLPFVLYGRAFLRVTRIPGR